MIIRPRPNLLQLFFIVRGSIVMRIFPQILVVAFISLLVVWLHKTHPGLISDFDGAPFALFGIALSVFIAFRNNACYDRWWEARRHWGELINNARTLGRQTLILNNELTPHRERLLSLTIAYAHALVMHLRPGHDAMKIFRHLTQDEIQRYQSSANPPEVILNAMSLVIANLRQQKTIADLPYQMLDHTIGQMGFVQVSCERILNTPVPFGYTLLLHRTAYLFCFLMPFGFADTLGWGSPFAAALAAYTFFGLDALGNELEDPFGNLPNDLPLGALAETIEINLREAMGETNLPALPKPVDYVLM